MDSLALSESKQIYNPLNIDDANDGSFTPTYVYSFINDIKGSLSIYIYIMTQIRKYLMHFIYRFKYWVDGPIGFTIAVIGLAVNFIAIVILAKQRVQRTFHLLMIFLSCWDFGYLILSLLCFALPITSSYYRDHLSIHLIPYVIPLAQVCLSGSCYSTIALTVERYVYS